MASMNMALMAASIRGRLINGRFINFKTVRPKKAYQSDEEKLVAGRKVYGFSGLYNDGQSSINVSVEVFEAPNFNIPVWGALNLDGNIEMVNWNNKNSSGITFRAERILPPNSGATSNDTTQESEEGEF